MKKLITTIGYSFMLAIALSFSLQNASASNEINTGAATNITNDSAKLLFSVNNENITKAGIEIKEVNSFGNIPPIFCDYLSSYNGRGDYEIEENSLNTGKTYFYRACGKDTEGKFYFGEVKSFVTFSEGNCVVDSIEFTGDAENWDIEGEVTNIKIITNGCEGGIKILAKGLRGIGSDIEEIRIPINNIPNLFIPNQENGEVGFSIKLSSVGCYQENNSGWKYRCINFLEVYDAAGSLLKTGNDPKLTPAFVRSQDNAEKRRFLRQKGILLGNCGSFCNFGSSSPVYGDEDNWLFNSIWSGSIAGVDGNSGCFLSGGETAEDPSDVYFDVTENISAGSTVRLNINLENGCKEKVLAVSVWAQKAVGIGKISFTNLESNFVNILTPNSSKLSVDFKIDEDNCSFQFNPDCAIFVGVAHANKPIFLSEKWISWTGNTSQEFKNKINFKKGVLAFDCGGVDGICSLGYNNWTYLSTNGKRVGDDGINLTPPFVIEKLSQVFDEQSPCYVPIGTDLGNGKLAGPENGYYKIDCYELLAPIPGIGVTDPVTGRSAIDKISEYELGEYINVLFQVAMGILMLLAVIMIIVAGVEYMTVESFFGKSRAKQRITGALTGLILGLGIFIILRTINPKLLEVNFGKDVSTVVLGPQDPDTLPGQTSAVIRQGGQLTTTGYELPDHLKQSTGIYCPKSGGRDEINKIAMSFQGKVAYRYGGKGADLPTGKVFYDNGKNYQCEGGRCGDFCPDNNFCLDCSGFTGHVLDCAGIQGNLGGTDAIFKNGSPITSKDLDNNIINGRELQPGDLIGGRSWHVIMYIGNGKVIESQSGNGASGRQKGAGVVVSDLANRIGKNQKFTHVRFIQ